jgi:hypothetical protein
MKLTPGELVDRLTILAIKLKRVKRGDRKKILEQIHECLDAFEALGLPDFFEESYALSGVNNEAYDVVELIYADFRDEMYGTPCWSLFGDARAQERAENTIKNCRRAHELNMERVRLKNAINAKAGAAQEVKSW